MMAAGPVGGRGSICVREPKATEADGTVDAAGSRQVVYLRDPMVADTYCMCGTRW